MQIGILYYDNFWVLEPVLALNLLHDEKLTAIALEQRPYTSYEQLRLLPDRTVAEVDLDALDLLIVPGGDGTPLLGNPVLRTFFQELHFRNKLIAGICFGATLMADSGILATRRCTGGGSGLTATYPWLDRFEGALIQPEEVVVDGNLITAAGRAHVEFAEVLSKLVQERAQE